MWKINKNCNILLLKALRARPVWVLVIASAFPRCECPTPIYWLIWLIRWWCGDGGDQLAGKSINWIQFWVRSSGETNWICGTGRPGAAVHREIGGSSQWWQDDAQLGQRAGKLSKKLHNRQMPRINNGVNAEWPQKTWGWGEGYDVRSLCNAMFPSCFIIKRRTTGTDDLHKVLGAWWVWTL